MGVTWSDSADRHGFTLDQVVYLIENAEYLARDFQDPRPPATVKPWLFIGRVEPYNPTLVEVIIEVRGTNVKVFHVMDATPENLERMRRNAP